MKQILITALLSAVLAGSGAWIARGLYSELVEDAGQFHLVNATADEHLIELVFPSGERRAARVGAGDAVDVRVLETGEGSVEVRADGEDRGAVGYVTSFNGRSVITLTETGAVFTHPAR